MKPDTFENAYSRIRAATHTRTQTEVAKLLGIKQSSISDAKKKSTIPDGWLITLYRACGLEPDWILYGQEPASHRKPLETGPGVHETSAPYNALPSRATVYAMARTDPNTGAWIKDGLENLPLPEPLTRPNLLVVKMDNGSMEPVIRLNAYVGIDCAEVSPLRGGEIYALDMPGEGLVIKRVIRDLEKKRLVLVADMPQYPPISLPLDNPGVGILGKAVWVIQEL